MSSLMRHAGHLSFYRRSEMLTELAERTCRPRTATENGSGARAGSTELSPVTKPLLASTCRYSHVHLRV